MSDLNSLIIENIILKPSKYLAMYSFCGEFKHTYKEWETIFYLSEEQKGHNTAYFLRLVLFSLETKDHAEKENYRLISAMGIK